MKLKDTCSLMNSADYKERFLAEYQQLKIRTEKLQNFVSKIDAAEICQKAEMPEHDCPKNLLLRQLSIMKEYLDILRMRAYIEGVELG